MGGRFDLRRKRVCESRASSSMGILPMSRRAILALQSLPSHGQDGFSQRNILGLGTPNARAASHTPCKANVI
jgi:hypothetical protein